MKHLSTSFLSTLVIQVTNIFTGVLSARFLLPQGKGELTAITVWAGTFALVGGLGISDAVAYYTSSYKDHTKEILSTGLFLALVLSVITMVAGYFILPVVLAGYGKDEVFIGLVYLPYILVNLLTLVTAAAVQGRMHLLKYNVLRATLNVIYLVEISILALVKETSVMNFVLASFIANLCILALFLYVALCNGWLYFPKPGYLRNLLSYGSKSYLSVVVLMLNSQLDQMLMSVFLKPSILGLYVIAVTVSGGVSIISGAISLVAFPTIAGAKSFCLKSAELGRFLRITLVLSIPAILFLLLTTPWILSFFFGSAYLPAVLTARILIVAAFFAGLNLVLTVGFKAFNRPLITAKTQLVGLVVTLALLALLLPNLGAVGAALASLLSYSLTCGFMFYSLKKELGIAPMMLLRPTTEDWNYLSRVMLRLKPTKLTLLIVVAGFLAALSGVLVALGYPLIPLGLVAIIAFFVIFISHWRWGIYGLLLYLPFSGLPSLILYPGPPALSLIKDIVFVIPAYLGFAIWYLNHHRHLPFPFSKFLIYLIGSLSLLLVLQIFNPNLVGGLLVGILGLKVWLFYIPLYFITYYLIETKEQLIRATRLLFLLGLIPVIIGVIQAILIYTGKSDLAYSLYGSAAATVTQDFAQFDVGGDQGIMRVPSIFTFTAQYSLFVLIMLPIGYVMWTVSNSKWYLIGMGLIVLAGVTSGVRSMLLLVPAYMLLITILERKWQQGWKIILLPIVSFLVMTLLLNVEVVNLLNFTQNIAGFYGSSDGAIYLDFIRAINMTLIGLGTGMSTNATRHLLPDSSVGIATVVENFYAKVVVEIGIPGLIIVILLFIAILVISYKVVHSLKDKKLKIFANALFVFLFLQIFYLLKGCFLDFDPVNVYFWLFAGIMIKLPALEQQRLVINV
ncbi:MAG: oligosaccharide flippase family protein [Chloroflexi bacterium]|nr:oligosaccharide flippase family protein [Chloroflexota bacterium]